MVNGRKELLYADERPKHGPLVNIPLCLLTWTINEGISQVTPRQDSDFN